MGLLPRSAGSGKAIKAVFQKLGGEAFGHSISGLLSNLPINVDQDLLDKAKELDKAYIPTRYPNSIPERHPLKSIPRLGRGG